MINDIYIYNIGTHFFQISSCYKVQLMIESKITVITFLSFVLLSPYH